MQHQYGALATGLAIEFGTELLILALAVLVTIITVIWIYVRADAAAELPKLIKAIGQTVAQLRRR